MADRDYLVHLLREWLRKRENAIGPNDSTDKHQRQVEKLWMEALRLTGGNVARALDIAREAVKSSRQPGESIAEYYVRLDGLPSGAFGPPGSLYGGVDKLQHFFGTAELAYTWGPENARRAGRLYERLDQLQALLGKNSGGYDMGDVHADDLGAEFGFNASIAPTSSIRFFVRHPGGTLGGAIGRLSESEQSLATPSTDGPGYDPEAPPVSTGFPEPGDYFDPDDGHYGPAADETSGGTTGGGTTPGGTTPGGTTPGGTTPGGTTPGGTTTGGTTTGGGTTGGSEEEAFEAVWVGPDGAIESYVAPADEQPGDLSDDDSDDDDDATDTDDSSADDDGYWPADMMVGPQDLSPEQAWAKIQLVVWSNRTPATNEVIDPLTYVPRQVNGVFDPTFDAGDTTGGKKRLPPGGPDYDPSLADNITPTLGNIHGGGTGPLTFPQSVAGAVIVGLRALASRIEVRLKPTLDANPGGHQKPNHSGPVPPKP